jgi:hypothetical protein
VIKQKAYIKQNFREKGRRNNSEKVEVSECERREKRMKE